MKPFANILCATDLTAHAQAAVPIACSLARTYEASLIMLYVRPVPLAVVGEFGAVPPEPREADEIVRARMQEVMPADFAGAVEYVIRDGDAAEEIVKIAAERRCDLIVLSTHGRSGLGRVFLGSVAEAVLRQAPCPVLTIKPVAAAPAQAAAGLEPAEVEPDVSPSELVTVCSVANALEAEVIRNALRSESIPCYVEGGHQAGLAGTLGFPVRLQVRAADANRANKFIQTHEAHHH